MSVSKALIRSSQPQWRHWKTTTTGTFNRPSRSFFSFVLSPLPHYERCVACFFPFADVRAGHIWRDLFLFRKELTESGVLL
jgi:hypothetical protein